MMKKRHRSSHASGAAMTERTWSRSSTRLHRSRTGSRVPGDEMEGLEATRIPVKAIQFRCHEGTFRRSSFLVCNREFLHRFPLYHVRYQPRSLLHLRFKKLAQRTHLNLSRFSALTSLTLMTKTSKSQTSTSSLPSHKDCSLMSTLNSVL